MAKRIHQEMLRSVEPLLSRFGMSLVDSTVGGASAEACVANQESFVRIAWHPRDGYSYYIGPLVGGRIPPPTIWYEPGQSLTEYSLDCFSELVKDEVPQEIWRAAARGRKNIKEGVHALMECADRFLKGDWARRPELDDVIRKFYEERAGEGKP